VITYRATLDVPRELVHHLSKLLRAERRTHPPQEGRQDNSRALEGRRQAAYPKRQHLLEEKEQFEGPQNVPGIVPRL
jgi:hypothetical protein